MVSCECAPAQDDRIGRRVAVGKCHGTVRYVGEVPPAKGVWLGVEWDDPSRGKHDGVYNGVRYFYTSHPTAGSLVRVEKADFGQSCVSALKERYGSDQLTLTPEELQNLQRAMNAPLLEMVGFEKISQKQSCFSSLEVMSLTNHQVSSAGVGLGELCPNVRELELSSNLFASWAQVAEITVNFPHLQFLSLSNNRLEVPEEPEKLQAAFKSLSHLVLGHVNYSWEQVCACSRMWPHIKLLQVPFNNITNLQLPERILENLTFLDLEGNSISRWEEINKLGSLDKLESLNLCDLGLENICLPSEQTLFQNLHCLMISDNKIDNWDYISELNKLPKLTELRFTNNPVLNNLSVATVQYKTACRIGSLKILNRSKIEREEKLGAEIDYLKEFGKEWLAASKSEELKSRFLERHPRFPELVKKHGAPEEWEMEVKSTSLTSSLVRITLRSDSKTLTKSLPRTMQLTRLIPLVQRLFHTGGVEPSLFYRSAKNPDVEVHMDKHLQSLDFYSIEDEDEIFVKW